MIFIPAYHRSPGGNLPPFRQVIHATCPGQPKNVVWSWSSKAGMALSTAHYFQEGTSGGSAHYVSDVSETISCVPVDAVAWHAPPNPHTLGYEICGQSWYTREQWLDPAVWPAVVLTAAQVKADAKRFGIPIHRLSVAEVQAGHAGQCGHVDVTNAFHQSDHTDPGPGFPWDRFMALLGSSGVVPEPVPAVPGVPVTPSPVPPVSTTPEEDVIATLDEVKAMLEEVLAPVVAQLHADHKVILHGGDKNHPYSIDSIAQHVGVTPEGQ